MELMEIFDTHFHFDGEETTAEFLERCQDDLTLATQDFCIKPDKLLMLCAGGSFEGSLRARDFAAAVPGAYFSCGVHPHSAEEYLADKRDFSIFRGEKKLLAAGEIGLDYFYDFSSRASQLAVLEEFLALALEWDLPAMLHLRDKDGVFGAYDDALAMLANFSAAGGRSVIHCYAGNAAYAEKFLELGCFFGVTGMFTFKAAHNIREAISVVPDERLLIETDSPYLAPVPYRGRSNTPGMVALVAQALGSSRNMTPEKAVELFTANGKKFYRIGE